MLPKKRRISRQIFSKLPGTSFQKSSKHFSLRSTAAEEARVAVLVSKKVAKQATVRNKIRRRTYSATRTLVPHLSKKLFLIIAKKGAENIRGEKLKTELAELLRTS